MSFAQGEIGNVILLTLVDEDEDAIDISAAASKKIKFSRHDGTTFEKTAIFYTDGSDGKVYCDMENGDLASRGKYEYMLHVVLTNGDVIKSNIEGLRVKRSL